MTTENHGNQAETNRPGAAGNRGDSGQAASAQGAGKLGAADQADSRKNNQGASTQPDRDAQIPGRADETGGGSSKRGLDSQGEPTRVGNDRDLGGRNGNDMGDQAGKAGDQASAKETRASAGPTVAGPAASGSSGKQQ